MPSEPPSPAPTLIRMPSFHPANVDWGSTGQPQYFVINPMHIITLHDRTKTFAVRLVEKIKSFSEKWFSHILLLIFLLIYACLGALLFQWLEYSHENKEKLDVVRNRQTVIAFLWNASRHHNEARWNNLAQYKLKEYELQIYQFFSSDAPADSEDRVWSFWGSLFFAGTVFTTIGYGHIVPATNSGKAATIIYAFIGIPFLLMVLADLGSLFTRSIKAVFYYLKLLCQTGKIRRVRRMGRRATAIPAQYMAVAWNKMPYMLYQNREKQDAWEPKIQQEENSKSVDEDNINVEIETKVADNKENPKDHNKEMDKDTTKLGDKDKEQHLSSEVLQFPKPEVDDEFDLPVSLAIILLMAYMMLGAFIFTLWEDWRFFESFYFVFISMSTIGFGDYVPKHPAYMMGTFIYLLFGLALTSMCINVIQEKLSATFEMAKLRIGTTIGLDTTMMMQDGMCVGKLESPEQNEQAASTESTGTKEASTKKETTPNETKDTNSAPATSAT